MCKNRVSTNAFPKLPYRAYAGINPANLVIRAPKSGIVPTRAREWAVHAPIVRDNEVGNGPELAQGFQGGLGKRRQHFKLALGITTGVRAAAPKQ